MLTPYIDQVHAREAAFLQANGFIVAGGANLGINTNTEDGFVATGNHSRLGPRKAAIVPRTSASLSCTAIKSATIIEQLERTLEMPAIH